MFAQALITDPTTTSADVLVKPPGQAATPETTVATATPPAAAPAPQVAATKPSAPTRLAEAPPSKFRKSKARPEAETRAVPEVRSLGYARADDPLDERSAKTARIPWPDMGRKVAVYDISAQRVYMPSGEVLEAHSGQGAMRDNPKFINVKMRGSTPPSTYRLSMRETRFHGVEALRLTPVDGVAPHGRVGLLTHSYLPRRPGDSAGCVAFKDYPRFLKAYKRGEITHLKIVSSMSAAGRLSAKVASLFSRGR